MQRRFCEIFEDKDKVELFQTILNTLQTCYFDISQRYDKERRIREMNQTLGGRLKASTGAERDTLEG